jgi:hypothetical protein
LFLIIALVAKDNFNIRFSATFINKLIALIGLITRLGIVVVNIYYQSKLMMTLGNQLNLVFNDDTPKMPIETFESDESSYWRSANYLN